MSRSVFYGFGAFVGSITGPTTCSFWPDDPTALAWAAGSQVPVDLSLAPQAVRAGRIAVTDIQADDFAGLGLGGQTTIGPMWPGGTMNGMCWLESVYWSTLAPNIQPPRVPVNGQFRAYEMCSVLYWWDSTMANRRFYGVHAEIQAEQGALALVTIWQPGTSKIPGQNPLGTWWLDLQVFGHPIEPGFTEIGVGPAPKTGALFLDQAAKLIVPFDKAKNPRPLGGVVIGRSHHVR